MGLTSIPRTSTIGNTLPRLSTILLVALVGTGSFEDAPRVRDIEGAWLQPFAPATGVNVLLFVSSDCPISNAYAPEMQRICGEYAAKGVACTLVYEDSAIDAAQVRRHLAEYRFDRAHAPLKAAIDATRAIATHANATVTPQAVVVDASGVIRYRGRIDNFYVAFGKTRQQVTIRDLRDALDAVLSGRRVARPETDALGCQIVPSDLARNEP